MIISILKLFYFAGLLIAIIVAPTWTTVGWIIAIEIFLGYVTLVYYAIFHPTRLGELY